MTVNKIEQWDPQYVASFGEAERDEAIRKLRVAFRNESRMAERNTIAAAYAIPVLVDSGISMKSLEDEWDRSHSQVTLWRRLGRAAHRFGITPTTEANVWNLLNGKAGANVKEVAAVLEPRSPGKDAKGNPLPVPVTTREDLDEALALAFKPDGKKRTRAEMDNILAGGTDDQTPESPDSDAAPDGDVQPTRSTKARIIASSDLIVTLLSDVSDEDWPEVYKNLAGLVEKIDGQVEARAPKKAAKKAS